jgi:hypothetical protein
MTKYRIYSDLAVDAVQRATADKKRPEMTWRDHLGMMLHIGAEIEHSLMVQYLYAAYSLGGEQVPPKHRAMVAEWQANILAVAKEEMGHLLTVQNVLTLIGAPINLGREELPWDAPFYPFTFRLEPLTLDSLARYIYAEMPAEGHSAVGRRKYPKKHLLERITRRATRGAKVMPHRVGELYSELIALIGDSERIPDSVFQDGTYASQAAGEDWGRNYQPDPKLLDAGGSLVKLTGKRVATSREAHVMVARVATRGQAVDALKALSLQGEAPISMARRVGELSHFDRFLDIYEEFEKIRGWQPSRRVAVNPTTLMKADDPDDPDRMAYISAKHSREWASLFNLRYRMLLRYLAHTFRLERVARADTPNLRAMVMHRVFGEMYNLKTIANILVQLPLRGRARLRAGPPFELPYTLHLAATELDVWLNHRDLIASSQRICQTLLHSGAQDQAYLSALFDLDSRARAWVECIIDGLRSTERPHA